MNRLTLNLSRPTAALAAIIAVSVLFVARAPDVRGDLIAGESFDETPPGQVYRTSGDAELFVDGEIIASSRGVERVIHQATKRDSPVFEPEMPWEGDRIYIYGTVHYDERTGRFRMWYNGSGMCYVESDDGIHWRRPVLGLFEYKGSTDNNIVLPGVGNLTVFVDEKSADSSQRYKALSGRGRYFRGAYSADGIQWTMYNEGGRLIPFGSELVTVNRDRHTGEYLAFIRTQPPKIHPATVDEKRTCALTTSTDFLNWTMPVRSIVPDEIDDQWVIDDDQRTEFYGWNGFAYGSQYLGFLTVFRITGTIPHDEKERFQSAYDGPIDVQLIHSRDGREWQRSVPRTPVIRNGPYEYDAGTILDIANNPIIVGDEVWLYYTAINVTHGGKLPPKRCTIALAKWRLDGFASLRAHWAQGIVETVPISAEGNVLFVNADASEGSLAVEVLDANGNVLPGYSKEECHPMTVDSVNHRIRWIAHDSIPVETPFALRFHFTGTDLFSFRIEEGSP